MVKKGNKFVFEGPTIVYCPTKKATMEVTAIIQGWFNPFTPTETLV